MGKILLIACFFISAGVAENVSAQKPMGIEKIESLLNDVYENPGHNSLEKYETLWSLLHLSYAQAVECSSLTDTVSFMRLLKIKKIPAEVDEFFSASLETFCIENPECFKKAARSLLSEDYVFIKQRLHSSLYHSVESLSVCQ